MDSFKEEACFFFFLFPHSTLSVLAVTLPSPTQDWTRKNITRRKGSLNSFCLFPNSLCFFFFFFFLPMPVQSNSDDREVARFPCRHQASRLAIDVPTNIGATRSLPTAAPLVLISDGGQNMVAIRSCSTGCFFVATLTPALALGQPITKFTLAILVGVARYEFCFL